MDKIQSRAYQREIRPHTGWHWMLDRGAELRRYRFEWPTVDLAFWATAMEWMTIAWVVMGGVWFLNRLLRNRAAALARAATSAEH